MIDLVLYRLYEIVRYDLPAQRFEVLIVAGGKNIVGTLIPPAEFIKQAEKSLDVAMPEPAKKWGSKIVAARNQLRDMLKILPQHHAHIFLKDATVETQAVPWLAIPYDSVTTWSLLGGDPRKRRVTDTTRRRPLIRDLRQGNEDGRATGNEP